MQRYILYQKPPNVLREKINKKWFLLRLRGNKGHYTLFIYKHGGSLYISMGKFVYKHGGSLYIGMRRFIYKHGKDEKEA